MIKNRKKTFVRSTVFAMGAAILVAGCQTGSGGGAGVGTVGGAAAGAGLGRAIFGTSTSAMLIGGAVGGLAGNQLLDRPAQQEQLAQQEASRDRAMQRQLDFERQSALQAAETERMIEEQRLFEEWRREQALM